MTNHAISELLRAASPALSNARCDLSELAPLLDQRNGFYAFEGALHVFPSARDLGFVDLSHWNSPRLWRSNFEGLAEGLAFFAEDAFGFQFGYNADGIHTFDPETGIKEWFAEDCESWAAKILSDWNLYTGYSLAAEWQRINGSLPENHRLIPQIPFVLGGDFSIANLYAMESSSAMKLRASIAIQIRDKPDGSQVMLKAR